MKLNEMKKSLGNRYKSVLIFPVLILSFASVAFGQAGASKDVSVVNTPNVNVVNTPTVGIDPAKNTVRVVNTQSDPLPVTVVGRAVRRPFQARVNLSISPGGNSSIVTLPIPAGKRLVIEDVSALTFQPQGQGLLISFLTAVDDSVVSNDPGTGDNGGFEGHDLVLVSQGMFNGLERSTAHEKMLVFADESVKTPSSTLSGIGVNVHLSRGTFDGSAGARVTFSGYVEDLPAPGQQD